MMTALEINAEREMRRMSQKEFGVYLAEIMKLQRPYTASEVSHWETERRPVPASVEAALLGKRWGRMGLQRIYVIGGDGGTYKIGRSMHTHSRCTQIRSDTKRDVRPIFDLYCVDAVLGEKLAHARLANRRIHGEWFSVSAAEAIEAVCAAVKEVNSESIPLWLSTEEKARLETLARKAGTTPTGLIKKWIAQRAG